ncbi:MAG TPA: serine/threonine-protein kinase, partial [Gemmataceae bacterium]|nr:serine/threonine-protein kinase [Gemmataceae bacterium]
MAVTSIAQLLGALAQYRLLAPDQIAAVSSTAPADPRALAKELLGRGWLTPYQINQLFRGCGRELLLGSYVLMEKVGEGGMGAVFKARNWKLGQIVALKLIRPERLGSADAVKRFRREIRAAAQLDHPNIVRALDADEVGGTHLFVMEYVDGTPLNQVVKERGPLPAAEACAHIRQAALGLHHAQERGLVHRDVKPHNLLLARDGVVKILDMGLARMAADPAAAESTMLTQEGQVMGTPDYMAPEQSLDAHRADIRSDLYSLGCTLYFLLAGQPPFPGGSLTHKLMAHQLSEPEPIEARRADAPAAVAALVRRLMAKDPARRFQTPADLAAALQDLLRGAPARVVPAPDASADRTVTTGGGNPFAGLDWDDSTTPSAVSAPPRRRRPLLLAGMACAVLLLGGLTLVMVLAMRSLLDPGRPTAGPAAAAPSTEPHPPTPQGEMEAALQALEDKAADPKITFADLAPDVQAFQAKYAGAPAAIKAAELLMKPPSPLDALDPANIPAKERFNWQPRELAAVLGGRRRRQWGNVTCVCESPDGKTLASGDSNGLIHLCKLPELEESLILRGHATGVQSLAFSTDGRYLVSGGTDYTAWIWDVRSGKETACCRGNTTHSYSVALSSDSQWLLTGRDAVGLVCFHTENSKKPPQFQGHEGGVLSVAFLAEDRRVLSVGQDGTVRLWDFVAGKELHQVKDQGAVVSPDSTRILSWNGEKGAIHYWQAETGRDLPSLETGTGNRCVVFSADGNYAISGGNDGALHYWDLETGKLVRTIGGDMLVVLRLSYLGGRRVLSGSSDKTVRVWSLEDGRQLRRLANMQQLDGVCYGARWAYQISDNAVRFWDVETGKEVQPLTGTPFQKVALSPDGKTLATLAADRTVSLWDAATGKTVHEPIPVPANPESTITPLVFSPDGRRLAVGTSANVILMIDVDSGQAVTLPRTGAVLGVAFSPQGDLLASVEGSDGVKLWDVARQQLKDAFAQGENPMSVVFTASGKQIVYYASHDNTIRYWDIAGAREAQSV